MPLPTSATTRVRTNLSSFTGGLAGQGLLDNLTTLQSGLKVNQATKAGDFINNAPPCPSLVGADGLTHSTKVNTFVNKNGFPMQIYDKTITDEEALNTHLWEINSQYNEGGDTWVNNKEFSQTFLENTQGNFGTAIAGENISPRNAIRIGTDGKAYNYDQTDVNDANKDKYVGLSLLTAQTGEQVYYANNAFFHWDTATIDAGKTYYIDATSGITSTKPTTGIVKVVGLGVGNNVLLIKEDEVESYPETHNETLLAGVPLTVTFTNERANADYYWGITAIDSNGDPVSVRMVSKTTTAIEFLAAADCTAVIKID